jgi:hypothetical protein
MSTDIPTPSFDPTDVTVKARSFGKNVLYSGVAHFKAGFPLDVYIEDLTFQFNFLDDASGTPQISTHSSEPKKLALTLSNFNSPMGNGLMEPFYLGQFRGFNIYMLFTVYAVPNSTEVN